MKIMKARDTHHSNDTHPYNIAKGFGVVVKNVAVKGMEKSIPVQFEPDAILADKRLAELSPVARSKITPLLKLLREYRYQGISTDDIVEGILDEFGD